MATLTTSSGQAFLPPSDLAKISRFKWLLENCAGVVGMSIISETLTKQIGQPNYGVNGLAMAYVLMGYGCSIICISHPFWWVNLLGVLLLTHTLVWAAYFVHEFIHGTIFRGPQLNALGARVMLFLTGSCYCRYLPLARYHLAHHKNRADFSAFDLGDFLRSLPPPLLTLIKLLEWLYFPAVNLILRWFCALSPFLGHDRQEDRWRNGLLLFVRGSLFVALAWYSWQAVMLYLISYLCFLNIMRFMDCFQHTYTVVQMGQPMPKYSLAYEERNTYSNLVLGRWHWLNLLFLNFGYHNAHHQVIYCPWYLLPRLNEALYGADCKQQVSLGSLVKNYHRFRMRRLFGEKSSVPETTDGLEFDDFFGDIGVSFLLMREPLDWLTIKTVDPNHV